MKRLIVFGFVTATALAANFALADSPKQDKKSQNEKPAVAQSGMKAYVNPETGQLTSRPATQADAAALDSAFKEDYSKIQEIHKADGSTEWIFNGQVDSALVATRGADGKIGIVCAEHGIVHDHLAAPLANGGRDER